MNRLIAKFFAAIVGLIHVITLGALAFTCIAVFGEDGKTLRDSMNQNNIPPAVVGLILFGLAVGYVLVVGFVSTVIAANENLERLNERLDKLPKSSA
jgi:hypothetical protein